MKMVRLIAAAAALLVPAAAVAAEALVHRDPGCGCCEQWVKQVRARFGRAVRIVDDPARGNFQKSHGVPSDLSSCHTAVIDGYVFEGHVPLEDVKRLLASRPAGIKGLAVAGMPLGSPGMEVPGRKADAFDVVAFGSSGRRIFARH
jgi:hypothetical protein